MSAEAGQGAPRLALTAAWAGLSACCAAIVLFAGESDWRGQAVAGMGVIVAAVVGWVGLGLRSLALFLGIALTTSLIIENIGVATGLPFGSYHFATDRFTLWIGRVPLLVGMLYFGVGLIAWFLAGAFFDKAGGASLVLAKPPVAALLMVLWDLTMDPSFSTVGKTWVWHQGGGFFGVPWLNFAGWFVTTWLIFQLAALALPLSGHPSQTAFARRGAALLYVSIGLSPLLPYLFTPDGLVADPAGRLWSLKYIHQAAVFAGLLAMLPAGVFAMAKSRD